MGLVSGAPNAAESGRGQGFAVSKTTINLTSPALLLEIDYCATDEAGSAKLRLDCGLNHSCST